MMVDFSFLHYSFLHYSFLPKVIPKKYRLRERDIDRVFRKGRPVFSEFWSMNYLESPRNQWHRMAVSISRKHDKRASWRNLYRRTVYDALLPSLKASTIKHFDCVLLLKKGIKLERAVPEKWIQDAKMLITKNTTK